MYEKYLSIITNFGCHYTCPYCIVKNNQIDIPETTIKGLNNLRQAIIGYGCNIVSVSGGGDPLHNYDSHIDWYEKLFGILEEMDIPLEMHTSYINSNFSPARCKRIVYHLHNKEQLSQIKRFGNEIIRAVFVVTDDMTNKDIHDIAELVKKSTIIDELSFRQRVDKNYKVSFHLHNELKVGHKKDWWYIEQNDYNLYYVENRVYTKYGNFRREGNDESERQNNFNRIDL